MYKHQNIDFFSSLSCSMAMKASLVFLVYSLLYTRPSLAQDKKHPVLDEVKGTISLTNNGISLIPSFSLGDPALLFDLKFIRKRLSFEPDMRFSLEGKPWSFIFWFRYQAIQKERFKLRIGAHPALNFRTVSVIRNGNPDEILEARRYVAAEIVPEYKLSEKVSLGLYYLYGHGFDAGVKTTHFIVLKSSFTKLGIWKDYTVDISPQVYHLRSDELKGYYVVGAISLNKETFPFSISALFNQAIDTEILPDADFTWNVSLVYRFPK